MGKKTGLLRSDPDRYYDGYTLYNRLDEREIYLIGMDGKVEHSWQSDGSGLAELFPSGDIMYGRNQHGVYQLNWAGDRVWSYGCDYHHDFDASQGDRIMILAGCHAKVLDRPDIFAGCDEGLSFTSNMFLEIEKDSQRVTWIWWAHEHIDELKELGVSFPRPVDKRSKYRKGDIFHCNTVEVLPDTQLGRRDQRFRAGNVMFSYRQVDTIGIVDRDTKEIVWVWGPGKLDGQHQPTMIPDIHPVTGEPMPGAGHILVFDNGRYQRDFSRVVELDPVTKEIVWSSPTNWYSWHISGAERLPNGNTFICDGPAGRLFEIAPEGEVVWEYQNPHVSEMTARKNGRAQVGFEDIGGRDTVHAVYRAMRYPRSYVEKILEDRQ